MDGDDENQKQQMMMTVRTLQYEKQEIMMVVRKEPCSIKSKSGRKEKEEK